MEYRAKNAFSSASYSQTKAQGPNATRIVTLHSQLSQISMLRRYLVLVLATVAIFTFWGFLDVEYAALHMLVTRHCKNQITKKRKIVKICQIQQVAHVFRKKNLNIRFRPNGVQIGKIVSGQILTLGFDV